MQRGPRPRKRKEANRIKVETPLRLPVVLAGSMAPAATALWVFATSYIFIGIEEVGLQVEQPFEILPMTQLCNVIMSNLEEAFDAPPSP